MRMAIGPAVFVAAMLGSLATGQEPRGDVARARLRDHWESIRTLEFLTETHIPGEDGLPDPARETYRADCKFGPDGLYAKDSTRCGADGAVVGKPQRFVGRYGRRDAGQSDHDRGLGVLAPAGRPLYQHVGWAQRAEPRPDGRDVVAFLLQERRIWLRCELDPEYGWLPRRVEVEIFRGGRDEIVVDRFITDNGLWFPGEFTIRNGDQPARRTRVTDLKINRPIDDSAFDGMPTGPPEPPRGMDPFSALRAKPAGE